MNWRQVAQVLRDLRKQANLTQKEVADKVGVDTSAVSRWESTEPQSWRAPPHDSMERWARMFGLEVWYTLLPARLGNAGARANAMRDAMLVISSASDEDVEAFARVCKMLAEAIEARGM